MCLHKSEINNIEIQAIEDEILRGPLNKPQVIQFAIGESNV
jgi:hypothetical protein